MGRRRSAVPSILRHKTAKSDRAYCEYRDPTTGERRFVTLGEWGSSDVEPAYKKLLAEIDAARTGAPKGVPITVALLAGRFLEHATTYYRDPSGGLTSEVPAHRAAVAVLVEVAGRETAESFGTARLGDVRAAMVAKGWTRPWINSQVRRIRGIWRWAAEKELVDAAVWHRLCSLRGLARGRCDAPEQVEVKPVSLATVDVTCGHLPPVLVAMIRFQLLTGCRPQDACNLRGDEIDRTGAAWVFRPGEHKGAWRGKGREVWIGPQAQELLAPWLLRAGGGYLFSPARRVEDLHEARKDGRKTKMWASHARRNQTRQKGAKKLPGEKYTADSYGKAIRRACLAASIEPWSPNQLRHTAATELRRRFGVETARVILGHGSLSTTEIYAERDQAAAVAAMLEVG